jgi:chromosome segregation ATPase
MKRIILILISAAMLSGCGENKKVDSNDYKAEYEKLQGEMSQTSQEYEKLKEKYENLGAYNKELNTTWLVMYVAKEQDKWLLEAVYRKINGDTDGYNKYMSDYYEGTLTQLEQYLEDIHELQDEYEIYKLTREALVAKSKGAADVPEAKNDLELERAKYLLAHEKLITAILGHATQLQQEYKAANDILNAAG